MNIREFGIRSPLTIAPLATTDQAIDLLWRHDSRHILAIEEGRLVGLVTDADLLESVGMLLRAERLALRRSVTTEEVLVADIMDARCACVRPDDDVVDAAHQMILEHAAALPVTEDGQLLGIVAVEDLLHLFAGTCWLDRQTVHSEPVLHFGSRILKTVGPDDTLATACTRLSGARIRHLLVTEGSRFVGMISDCEIRTAIGDSPVGAWLRQPVRQHMITGVQTLRPRDTLTCAAEVMRIEKLSAAPVTSREGELISIITVTDLLRALAGPGPVRV